MQQQSNQIGTFFTYRHGQNGDIFNLDSAITGHHIARTRELAVQIQKVILALGNFMNVQCHAVRKH